VDGLVHLAPIPASKAPDCLLQPLGDEIAKVNGYEFQLQKHRTASCDLQKIIEAAQKETPTFQLQRRQTASCDR